MTDQEKWKADPTRGRDLVEPRRAEVVEQLKSAADAAFYHIEQQLEADIAAAKKEAGEKKQKITRAVQDAETKPAMTIVRKYWQQRPDEIMHHLIETILRNGKQ